jgi:hypothetical protein
MANRAEFVTKTLKPMKLEEAFRFLVKLANTDVAKLREPDDPGAPVSFIYELTRYLFVTRERKLATQIRKAQDEPERLELTIKDIRKLLDGIIAVAKDGAPSRLRGATFDIGEQKISLTVEDGKITSFRDANELHTAVLDTAVEDFDDEEWKLLRIARCQRCLHDPPRYFYKVKLNQTYCSHECANNAAAKRRSARVKGGADSEKKSKEN